MPGDAPSEAADGPHGAPSDRPGGAAGGGPHGAEGEGPRAEGAQDPHALAFAVFTEISIVEQLSRTRLEAVLPDGLLVPHFGVLNHLSKRGDGRTMSSLAFSFQVTKATMTNTVRRLAERGLVDVRADPQDRRAKRVYMTDAGRAMREAAIAALGPELDMLLREVGQDTFAALRPHLERLRTVLDAARTHRANDPAPRTLVPRGRDGEPRD